ncbi:MAG: hypothetical protein FGM33_04120 [Candidatus Kapabacteria bacterium]|nr:hypothetical protein [Candidatus Kapabacteria bacterium]
MNVITTTPIPKNAKLPLAQDYLALRKLAIQAIERLGSAYWTDFNTHDPGITILEALTFVVTDLAWRAGWNVQDLLAETIDEQAFPTAGQILTVRPTTLLDYRRLFIDLDDVRNAWVSTRSCLCGSEPIQVKGLYDVHVELDDDPELGDLNDLCVEHTLILSDAEKQYEIIVEVRFPDMRSATQEVYQSILDVNSTSILTCVGLFSVSSANAAGAAILSDEELRRHHRNIFLADVELKVGAHSILINDVSIRVFAPKEAIKGLTVDMLKLALTDSGDGSVIRRFSQKVGRAQQAKAAIRRRYHNYRNLDEDLCRVDTVSIERVGICADISVQADADIERVQADIWLLLQQYLSPVIQFYGLNELLDDGVDVESIFNGPPLRNGFIRSQDLHSTQLRTVIYGSDIINLVMAVPGVAAVQRLRMTKYNDRGEPVKGAADPVFVGSTLEFNQDLVSASWTLHVTPQRLPRLDINLSTMRFTKSGLPFDVDRREALDVLVQLRGATDRPKHAGQNDLPIPLGRRRNAADISPVQYLLPQTYGVSPAGLPHSASHDRKSRAHQLQAYLMVFEQILANAFQQVESVGKVFSIKSDLTTTHKAFLFTPDVLACVDDIAAPSLSADVLQQITESTSEFLVRRNSVLDHLLARFGLDISQFALLLTDWKGREQAQHSLLADKINLLNANAEISSQRAGAMNRSDQPLSPHNAPVIRRRINLLLGFADVMYDVGHGTIPDAVILREHSGAVWFQSITPDTSWLSVAQRLSTASAYRLTTSSDRFALSLLDASGGIMATSPIEFISVAEAESFVEECLSSASMLRTIVVEHLLLRPKFPGDAIYRECDQCEDADPFSFRLTMVMPGWVAPYNTNLQARDFADRTIFEELPSHLLAKICWVGNDDHTRDECDPVIDEIVKLIQTRIRLEDGSKPDCESLRPSVSALYMRVMDVVERWRVERRDCVVSQQNVSVWLESACSAFTAGDFGFQVDVSSVWSEAVAMLLTRASDIILFGQQFDRFEQAWYRWREADSRYDWSEYDPEQRLRAWLNHNVRALDVEDRCSCASAIVSAYGEQFRLWMDDLIMKQEGIDDSILLPEFEISWDSKDVAQCSGKLDRRLRKRVLAFLRAEYSQLITVSYRLTVLVRLLESLTNVYPKTTLHDCQDGSDINPVRLNRTSLGSLTPGAGQNVRLIPIEEVPAEAITQPRKRQRKPKS